MAVECGSSSTEKPGRLKALRYWSRLAGIRKLSGLSHSIWHFIYPLFYARPIVNTDSQSKL